MPVLLSGLSLRSSDNIRLSRAKHNVSFVLLAVTLKKKLLCEDILKRFSFWSLDNLCWELFCVQKIKRSRETGFTFLPHTASDVFCFCCFLRFFSSHKTWRVWNYICNKKNQVTRDDWWFRVQTSDPWETRKWISFKKLLVLWCYWIQTEVWSSPGMLPVCSLWHLQDASFFGSSSQFNPILAQSGAVFSL